MDETKNTEVEDLVEDFQYFCNYNLIDAGIAAENVLEIYREERFW